MHNLGLTAPAFGAASWSTIRRMLPWPRPPLLQWMVPAFSLPGTARALSQSPIPSGSGKLDTIPVWKSANRKLEMSTPGFRRVSDTLSLFDRVCKVESWLNQTEAMPRLHSRSARFKACVRKRPPSAKWQGFTANSHAPHALSHAMILHKPMKTLCLTRLTRLTRQKRVPLFHLVSHAFFEKAPYLPTFLTSHNVRCENPINIGGKASHKSHT